MKRALYSSLLVSSAGWLGSAYLGSAAVQLDLVAQADPFQRTAPAVVRPAVTALPPAAPLSAAPAPAAAPATALGNPRSSAENGITKVVFDLPEGARYTLNPQPNGLSVGISGVNVQPESRRLNDVVYQASGNGLTLGTPFPLSAAGGWRASEATIASGTRVLILEFGEGVQGGATSDSLSAMNGGSIPAPITSPAPITPAPTPATPASAAPAPLVVRVPESPAGASGSGPYLALTATPMARSSNLDRTNSPWQLPARPQAAAPAAVPTPVPATPQPIARPSLSQPAAPQSPAQPAAAQPVPSRPVNVPATPVPISVPTQTPQPLQTAPQVAASASASTAPGDQVGRVRPPALPAELAGAPGYTAPDDLTGQAPGTPSGGRLDAPRIGKNPGITRVVVDLPAGAAYRIEPQSSGLNVFFSGVQPQTGGETGVSSELNSWAYQPVGGGTVLTLRAGGPLGATRGWRAFFLPPADASGRSRLAIDVAPALANLRPLQPQERRLNTLASLPVSGLSYASAVKPRVVLDPGHGGSDPGAIGSVQEKQIVLDVALRVRQILNASGIDVVMTRDRDMELNPSKATDLRMRANMGALGYAFVSIHANSMPAQSVLKGYGIETWYNNNHRYSGALASILQKNMVDTSGAFSRGIKNHRSLAVLRTNRVPAALVEIGFVSHPVDSINLTDQNYMERVALGIAKGIHESLRTGVHAAPSDIVGQGVGLQAD